MQTAVAPIESSRAIPAEGAAHAPARPSRRRSSAFELSDLVILELVCAADVGAGMRRAVEMLRRRGAAGRVEWWAPTEDGTALRLQAADGRGRGRRSPVSAGPAGVIVITGERWSPQLVAAANRLAPQLRRRWTEERLARQAANLARQNRALEDFASLVAHELKAPLHAALLLDDPAAGVELALDLVDSLLEAAHAEACDERWSAPAEGLDEALRDLGPIDAEVVAELPDRFPLPAAPLRVILRNLVANAVAAGARHVHVTTADSGSSRTLVVDDDGVGPGSPGEYNGGSGLGLGLIGRLADRFGGSVALTARADGGARATLAIPRS